MGNFFGTNPSNGRSNTSNTSTSTITSPNKKSFYNRSLNFLKRGKNAVTLSLSFLKTEYEFKYRSTRPMIPFGMEYVIKNDLNNYYKLHQPKR